jgi:hypothetical protein
MDWKLRVLGVVLVGLTIAGCDSDNDDIAPAVVPPPPETTSVRFIHAVPDAPEVAIGNAAATFATDVGFKAATAFNQFVVGDLEVQVDAELPGGLATVVGPVTLDLAADTLYSVIAIGEVATIDALIIAEPDTAVGSGNVRAQVVHAAPNAPDVDVYVTAPGADLTMEAPLGSFAFGEELGPVEVPGGDYQIRVTLMGDPSTVAFDSGTVTLPAGADLLVLAVDNTGPGDAAVSLVVADGTGSFEILDTNTPAELRVIHASPDAPNVDVIVNDDFMNPVLADVPYPVFSDYLAVPPEQYNVKVTAAGNPGAIVIDADLDLEAGVQYSVYATDLLATIAPFVLIDDNREVATEAKVRIVHAAASAGLVDIYVTGQGADITSLDPTFAGVDFLDETGYVSLAGGDYSVTVTAADTKTVAIGPADITLSDGSVYTAAARDATGGGAPFGLILLDDFNP